MRNFHRFFLVSAFALGLFACGSAQKNATEKLENGEYQSALEIFDRILKHSPDDVEAREGQKRARAGVLSDKLIGVRKARDSGSTDAALDQLLEVASLETAWNTFPPAAARFTQDEETNFAWKPYAARIEGILKAKQPLRAEAMAKRYAPVFTGPKHATAQAALQPAIARAGRSHCAELANGASARDAYYSGFVARYCRYWKSPSAPKAAAGGARTKDLFSGVAWEGKLDGMPSESQSIVRAELEDALKQSAWYDPAAGRKLPVTLSGNYSFSHAKNLVTRVKEYDENENYQVVEQVTKTRDVKYDAQEYQTDPKSGVMKMVTVQRVRPETYTEPQTITRSRSVKKQFPYSALFHQQSIEMAGTLATKIGGQDVSANAAEKAAAEGDEQSLTNAGVGLAPMRPALLDPNGWVRVSAQKWRAQFAEKLRAEWISQICHAPESRASASEVAETVLKCRREPSAGSLAYVNDWYVRSFGLAQAEVEKLLPEK